MAGSYSHITNSDGSYRGTDLLDHLGDASEALEECWHMINWLTKGDKSLIYQAWFEAFKVISGYEPYGACEEEFWSSDES